MTDDTDPPHAITFPVHPRATKPRFSTSPDERVHPLPVHLVDQTLLLSTDRTQQLPVTSKPLTTDF